MDHVTPALASVFCERNAPASWSKLNDSNPFSQLFSKYWGKKIEDEVEEWVKSHSIVYDLTSDIGPGCYVLDLGIKFFYPSKLWVRQDYIRIYDYCRERYAEGRTMEFDVSRSVVITGQPGIGKTYWVTYAVRRRLGEQEPFLWYQDGNCFLFIKDGVYQQSFENVNASDFMPFLWAFFDADGRESGIPGHLGGHSTNLYIMFTTSPKRQQWKCLEKCTDVHEIVMNPWTLEEIRQGAKIRLTNEQQGLVENAFKRYGPIPRICINYIQDQKKLLSYERRCQAAASQITAENLRRFVLDGRILDLAVTPGSHAIFMIRRCEIDDLFETDVEPISAYVEMLLMTAIDSLQRFDRIMLYHIFVDVNATRVAGLLYKSLGHVYLGEGITLTLKPMVQRKERTHFHWKSGEEQAEKTIVFPFKAAIMYENRPASVQPNRLYIPRTSNQVAFDSFQVGANIYIFQFTLSNSHDIKIGIKESLSEQLNILPKGNWHFVFITPPTCEVDVKATSAVKEILDGVTLYSAHLEIGQQAGFNEGWWAWWAYCRTQIRWILEGGW